MEKYSTSFPVDDIEYNPDPELIYLREFWGLVTNDWTVSELREFNDLLENEYGIKAPQEYSI